MRLRGLVRGYTRRHAQRVATGLLRELPSFLTLLLGLLRDRRVPPAEKALFVLVIAYVLMPADLVPDFLGVLGFIDDFYLLGLALARLLGRAGPDLLLEHWAGDPKALGFLVEGVEQLGDALPGRIRRTVRRLAGAARRRK